jgi:antirestriction protein ArdC
VFHEPINWYRTALHELGHWTGHVSRLGRDQKGGFGSEAYAKEELVAEMAAAFTCASLGIAPTVRHSDYIGSWLTVLQDDEKAIFRAASQASKASDFLLALLRDEGGKLAVTLADQSDVACHPADAITG